MQHNVSTVNTVNNATTVRTTPTAIPKTLSVEKENQVSLLTQQLLISPYLGISKLEEYINYVYL